MSANNLPDTQNKKDNRNIIINKVGIKDINHPIVYIDKSGNNNQTIGNFNMTVSLEAKVKGTHMSRFIEILNEQSCEFSADNFNNIVNKVKSRLDSEEAHVTVDFTFFRKKIAPSSKVASLMDYQLTYCGTATKDKCELQIKVVVPVTSLCPCSKSISNYGAHNQRSHITIAVKPFMGSIIYAEDLIDLAENKASCDLYAILKRDDEKFVTEKAYDNPAFVEDLVRDIAVNLNNDERVSYYCVESENFESIHNHSAYALIENQK